MQHPDDFDENACEDVEIEELDGKLRINRTGACRTTIMSDTMQIMYDLRVSGWRALALISRDIAGNCETCIEKRYVLRVNTLDERRRRKIMVCVPTLLEEN